MTKIECVICKTKIIQEEVSNYASYSWLPSPCCDICFSVNDFTIKSLWDLQIKSLLYRAKQTEKK